MIKSFKDLKVFQESYEMANQIFLISSHFPKEEKYSLVDQMRRSSRSISANIVEGWAKRIYINVFKRHLVDAIGSCEETKVWIGFAASCHYIDSQKEDTLIKQCEDISKMLRSLLMNWKSYKET